MAEQSAEDSSLASLAVQGFSLRAHQPTAPPWPCCCTASIGSDADALRALLLLIYRIVLLTAAAPLFSQMCFCARTLYHLRLPMATPYLSDPNAHPPAPPVCVAFLPASILLVPFSFALSPPGPLHPFRASYTEHVPTYLAPAGAVNGIRNRHGARTQARMG